MGGHVCRYNTTLHSMLEDPLLSGCKLLQHICLLDRFPTFSKVEFLLQSNCPVYLESIGFSHFMVLVVEAIMFVVVTIGTHESGKYIQV